MQIHEAVSMFEQNHHPDERVWRVVYRPDQMKFLVVRSGAYVPRFGVGLCRQDRFITKQRGGLRFFTTLDAAANAIRQIGQSSFEVEL